MSAWEQFLATIPDGGCATPAGVFLLRVITEASIQRLITDEQLLTVAQDTVQGARR
jgi:hypothetical protein